MFEYKVVPAPTRGVKAKGVKGAQARFANALEIVMNDLGAQGWEYQRTDTLPSEERQGLTGKTTTYQNLLVFRRALAPQAQDEQPAVAALIEDQSQTEQETAPETAPQPDQGHATPAAEAEKAEIAAEAEGSTEPSSPPPAPEAQKRVDETLSAKPFSMPWDRRKPASKDADDPHLPAE